MTNISTAVSAWLFCFYATSTLGDDALYDFSHTIGALSFTGDGKEYTLFSVRGEKTGLSLLTQSFQLYYYTMEEYPGDYPQITDEFYFFSYDDDLTLYMGDHWIGDGIKLAQISDEDYLFIHSLKTLNGRQAATPGHKEKLTSAIRKNYAIKLEEARKLKMQGYAIEAELDEILKRERWLDETTPQEETSALPRLVKNKHHEADPAVSDGMPNAETPERNTRAQASPDTPSQISFIPEATKNDKNTTHSELLHFVNTRYVVAAAFLALMILLGKKLKGRQHNEKTMQ